MSWRRSTRLILGGAVCAALSWSGAAGAGEQDRGSDRITTLPGLGPVAAPQYGGYASVDDAACAGVQCDGPGEAGLYYWFVATPGATRATPTILWTNGGPGATSFWGFFTENGPYVVRRDGSLREREQAWNETANYLIFDQPLGVGLSFAPDERLPANVQEGVDQWYRALVHFLERHSKVAAGPIFLAGESYGGTYTPLLAQAILDGNERAGREVVHLGGVIVVSGWVDPVVQQSMDTTFALSHGIITDADKVRIDGLYDECKAAVEAQTPSSAAANDACGKMKSAIQDITGLYLLNIAARGDPPTKPLVTYLNRRAVRDAVHARRTGTFSMFSEAIGDRYTVGEQDSYRSQVESLLDEGVPIMVVSGLNDATDVNPLGTAKWLDLLGGDAAAAFRAAPTTQWKQGTGKAAPVLGYVQDGGTLSWVKVLNAGHLAVGDQPLLIDLIDDQLLAPGG